MDNIQLIVVGAIGIVVLLGAFMFAFPSSSAQKEVHKRAQKLASSRKAHGKADEKISSLRKLDEDPLIEKLFAGLPSLKNVRKKVERLNGTYTLKTYATTMAISLLGAFFLLKIVFGMGLLLAIVISVILSYMIPNFILNRKLANRNKEFLILMPDALDLIVRGLRSGLPVTESMQAIADEIAEPIKSVFEEMAGAIKMGMSFEDTLHETAEKLDLNEFNFFAISIALQRETGGNLAEILENLSETIRSRTMMKLKIRAISSEARMSSYIVGSLPFIVMAALLATSPNYLDPLFETLNGNIALGTAMGMFASGMFIMRKMAQMEV